MGRGVYAPSYVFIMPDKNKLKWGIILTIEQKNNILNQISDILDKAVSEPNITPAAKSEYDRELLTINECLDIVKGLSAHTLRILLAKGAIASIRTGEGKTGKILVPKAALLDYFDKIYKPSK